MHTQLMNTKKIGENLFFQALPGADPVTVSAPKNCACSTPGQEVYIDLENQCIITRTGSGLYFSVQKSGEAMNAQINLLERLARLHS